MEAARAIQAEERVEGPAEQFLSLEKGARPQHKQTSACDDAIVAGGEAER